MTVGHRFHHHGHEHYLRDCITMHHLQGVAIADLVCAYRTKCYMIGMSRPTLCTSRLVSLILPIDLYGTNRSQYQRQRIFPDMDALELLPPARVYPLPNHLGRSLRDPYGTTKRSDKYLTLTCNGASNIRMRKTGLVGANGRVRTAQ